jgi:general secretion pathway protein M
MKDWFESRSSSERRLLVIAGVVIVLLLTYVALVEPFMSSLKQERKKVVEQGKLIAWMKNAGQEIHQLSAQSGGARKSSGTPLLTLIDKSIKQHRLSAFMNRLEPQGSGKAQIWLNQVPFDSMVRWLQTLSNQYGTVVRTVSIQRQEKSGIVNARVVLEGGV